MGEIWISGGNIAEGYWNRPEETKHTFGAHIVGTHEGPFLRTGDLGFMQDGHLYITGRLKDLLIVRGRNYYPQDIEATVEGINRILRPGSGAAFSITENDVEQLVVVQEIQRREVEGVDWNDVIKEIRANIAREHGIRAHAVILIRRATIAKTSSGKIMRSETQPAVSWRMNWRSSPSGGHLPEKKQTSEVEMTSDVFLREKGRPAVTTSAGSGDPRRAGGF